FNSAKVRFIQQSHIYPVVSCWLSIDDFKYGEVCRRRTFSFANLKQSRIKKLIRKRYGWSIE
ncbi:TPA: hypothetical protein ACJ2ZR_006077, partial [Klebsiella pneumoniae]